MRTSGRRAGLLRLTRRSAIAMTMLAAVTPGPPGAALAESKSATHSAHSHDHASPKPDEATCLDHFGALDLDGKLKCLQRTRRIGLDCECRLQQVSALLEASDGNTDHRVIAGLLDVIRSGGENARILAETVSRHLLPHQAAAYQGRDKWHVLRLRAYAFVTLSEIGFPERAMPLLVDTLAYVDERISAVEFGAAARLAGMLNESGRQFIPHLVRTLGERFAEEEFSLDRYDVKFPPEEATTVQIEAVRSLAMLCTGKDREALRALQAIADSSVHSTLDPRLVQAAKNALKTIRTRAAPAERSGSAQRPPSPGGHLTLQRDKTARGLGALAPWKAPGKRRRLRNLDIGLVDHDGRDHILKQLVDRPVLLTFFYTRCQNAGKCSLTVYRMGLLQQELRRHGLANAVRLLAITFEPDFDTPLRLRRYATDRGLELGSDALAVRLDRARHAGLLRELGTPVGYGSGGLVNTHGVEVILLDRKGRLARRYRAPKYFDDAVILRDLQRLLADG